MSAERFNLTVSKAREDGATQIIDLRPTLMTRMRAAVTAFRGGDGSDWFGPGPTLPPQAPPDAAGREMDYPYGYNLNTLPKYGEGLSFGYLQTLSYTWDLLRLIIETRKDQMCQLDWNIMPRDTTKKSTPRCEQLEQWFQLPDKEHTWSEWLRMLLEDLLVIDAPTLYPRMTRGGELFALEPVDGSTIKRVIDERGRTPIAPYTAYQQILKGLPATDYDRDSLIYRPRNLRASKVYGYSPVEQLIVTINIALNREASLLQYYTEGSTPDLILSVPETWTPDQIKVFKKWWDSILQGNTAAKRGTMFVANGMKAVHTKDKILTDKMDEWLARMVCFCFSMSPQPFIQQTTRAGAQVAATQAKEEGNGPCMAWIRNLMDFILVKYFNEPSLCFRWSADQETDPLTRAQVNNIKARAGAISINEWRQSDGQDPIPGGEEPMIYVSTGAVPLDMIGDVVDAGLGGDNTDDQYGNAPPSGEQRPPTNARNDRNGTPKPRPPGVSNAPPSPTRTANNNTGPRGDNKSVNKADDNSRPVTQYEVALSQVTYRWLQQARSSALSGYTYMPNQEFGKAFVALIEKQMYAGKLVAAAQVLGKAEVDVLDGDSAAYARSRLGELITELGDTTKAAVERLLERAAKEGWTQAQLEKALREDFAFSRSRAQMIAATEMNDALTHAELSTWRQSGVVKAVVWSKSNLEGVCSTCEANAEQGPVPLGSLFLSGDDGPPAHPNCRCALIPIVEL